MVDMSCEVPVKDNRLEVYKYLKQLGRPPKEIAAIMGNISVESPTFDDQEVEDTKREDKGHGIFQLTDVKKRAYKRQIADKNLPDNYKTQIDFMLDTIYNYENLSDGVLEVEGMKGKAKHDVSGFGKMKELRISLLKQQLEVQIKLRKKAETRSLMYNNRLNNLRKKIANYFGVSTKVITDHGAWKV